MRLLTPLTYLHSLLATALLLLGLNGLQAANVDYLVVTHDDVLTEFQALAAHRASHNGYDVVVKTVAEITTAYSGSDLQQKIRACITDYHQNYTHTHTPDGRMFVLLGGDDTLVPDRNCWVSADGDISTDTPTDLYYAALNGTWNADGDSIYGEVSDNVDMTPHVLLGRVPVRTAAHATAYVNKLIAFENHTLGLTSSFYRKHLTVGDELFGPDFTNEIFNDGLPEYTANSRVVSDAEAQIRSRYKNEIRPYWEATGQFAVFADTLTSWDSTPIGGYTLNEANLKTRMDEGWFFATWDAHGAYTFFQLESGSFTATSASQLTKLTPFVYTIACFTAGFDKAEPCLAEAFLRNPNGGALAYIASSRFGKTDASMEFQTQFNQAVFRDKKVTIGQAFTDHKAYYIGNSSGNNSFRWLMYGLVLLGDPALSMQTPPAALPVQTQTSKNTAKLVALNGQDDALPNANPDYIITSLPANGTISDPGAGAITTVPYTLAAKGSFVQYTPANNYVGSDSFQYKLNDGGSGPDSGDSNTATASIGITQSVEIILDNNAASCTKNGFAFTSTQTTQYGSAPAYDKWVDRWFRFNPTIATAGWYQTYFWVASGLTSDPTALLHVNHAGGTTDVTLNLNAGTGNWVSLGTYYFNAGTSHYIELDCKDSAYNVFADGVKLVSTTAPAGIVITELGGTTAVEEYLASTDSYSVVLSAEPAANVTISVSANSQVTVNPTQLVFTPANWNTPQSILVSAVDDALIETSVHTSTITHSASSTDAAYNGMSINAVTVSITDNDSPAAAPSFAPVDGTSFIGSGSVTLTSATPGASIYYTTNGSTPDASSTLYTSPISVSANTTVKAIAIKEGIPNSNVATASYTIITQVTLTPSQGNTIRGDQATTVQDSSTLLIGYDEDDVAGPDDKDFHGILEFDLSTLTTADTIESVTLTLKKQFGGASSGGNSTIEVYQLLPDFTASQATWNNRNTATAWTTPGADSIGNDRSGTLLASFTGNESTHSGNLVFTSQSAFVTAANAARGGKLRIFLRVSGEDTNTDRQLWGCSGATNADATVRPKLTLQIAPPALSAAETWRQTYFGTTANTGTAADDFDADGDGQKNLMERALGTSPVAANDAYLPSQSMVDASGNAGGQYLSITYRRRVGGDYSAGHYAADGINYIVEWNTDLGTTWNTTGLTEVSFGAVTDGLQTVTVRMDSQITTANRAFIRLRVTAF